MGDIVISFDDFITWATLHEKDAFNRFTESPIVTEAYQEAEAFVSPLYCYLSPIIYRLLLYRLTMHYTIINSQNTLPPISGLYDKYEIANSSGLMQSVSDKTTAATRFIGGNMQDNANLQTMLLMKTPYGQYVESVFENLQGISITIRG